LEIFTGDYIRFRKGSNEYVRIDTNGKVGIGTTSPSHTLHVAGSGLVSDGLYANFVNINDSVLTSANGSLVVNGIITTQNNSIRASDFGIYGDTNNRIRKSDGTTFAYEVSSSGNAHSFGYTSAGTHYSWASINTTGVGIGTTSPSGKLHIYDNNSAGWSDTSFRIQNPASTGNTYFDIAIGTNTGYNDYIWFKRQGNPIAAIDASNKWYHHVDCTIETDKQFRANANANALDILAI